jgi:hypothetical protein
MPAYVAFGDAEAAVCEILRDSDNITAFAPVTVATDLLGYAAPDRRLRVSRTGGVPTVWMRMDNAIIEIETFAESKAAAFDLAAASRAAVFAARGNFTGYGVDLFDVADAGGLSWEPEPSNPDAARYIVKLSLVTRPTA